MDKSLKDIINEQLEIKGLTLEKISLLTNIPLRFLKALGESDIKKLPAAPYVRGYLVKMGKILDLDGQELWQLYKSESGIKISGPADRLPSNRFAIKTKLKKTHIIAVVVIVIVISYLIWRAPRLLGEPKLEINYPPEETIIINTEILPISGKIDSRDKLIIDSEEIIVDANGNFFKNYKLQTGLNVIEFKVKKFLGKEIKVERQVIYQISE
jgi:hypothetical protein